MNTGIISECGFVFRLMDDRLTLQLGEKDFFSVSREEVIKAVKSPESHLRVEIKDYRYGLGYPPCNMEPGRISFAEYQFSGRWADAIYEWARA